MKCSNCGKPVEEGRLFCMNCGHEIQWVPDYDSFGTFMEQQERLKKDKEESLRREKARAAAAAEAARRQKKKKKMAAAAAGTFLFVVILAGLAVKIYTDQKNNHSFDYQLKKAKTEFQKQDYESAYDFASRAVELNGENEEASLLLSRVLVELDQEKKAAGVLETFLEENPSSENAYGDLIAIYLDMDDPESVRDLMDSCEDETIRNKYSAYIAEDPVFSLPEGVYDQKQTIEIYSKDDDGTVYYTTDGSEPGKDSQKYTSGIQLEEGSTTVKAVVINSKGILSNTVTRTYDIQLSRPDPPQIAPSSGEYTTAMDTSIYVIVPEGCTAYYAFDQKPTVNSAVYSGAVQMKEGTHTFYAIVQDENGKVSAAATATYTLTQAE